VLSSGNHAGVEAWRRREAIRATLRRRPDLIAAAWPTLPAEVRRLVAAVAREEGVGLPDACR
jgi:tRNA (guanine37-N1)-methyltransferase